VTTTTITGAIRADWGPPLERACRLIAPLLVAVYAAGYCTGAWLHRLNDRLAAAYVQALGLSQPAAAHVLAEPPAEPIQPVPAAGLAQLPVVELRRLARERLGSSARIEGRRIAQARRQALLLALA